MNDHGESSTNGSSNIVSIISNSKNKAPEKIIKRMTLTGLEKQVLTGEILRVKAQEFADRMSINDFKISPGWVTDFKKRHNLSQFARQGEGNSAPLEDLPRFRNELQQLIQSYPVETVFNCDETA